MKSKMVRLPREPEVWKLLWVLLQCGCGILHSWAFPRPSSLLTNCKCGIPKTVLRFSNSPEGLTERSKATVAVYDRERTQGKISQERRVGQGPARFQVQAACCPLPRESI